MKKLVLFFFFLITYNSINAQFLNFTSKNIYFLKSFITDSRFKTIWLQNQSEWQLSRSAIFVNLSEIFIVLDEKYDEGHTQGVAFINGQDYNINYVQGQFFYESGFLFKIINMYKDGSRIMMDDYSEWDIVEKDYQDEVIEWLIPRHVVVTYDKQYLIDPKSQNKIKIKFVDDE